jgi:hypothetical protein
VLFGFFFLRHGLIISLGWPGTHDAPASTFCMLGLQMNTTMSGLNVVSFLSFFFFFFALLGLELRAYTLSHSISPFVLGIFKIGSLELFARAGFKL